MADKLTKDILTVSYIQNKFSNKEEAYEALSPIEDLVSSNSELEELVTCIFEEEFARDFTLKELITILRKQKSKS